MAAFLRPTAPSRTDTASQVQHLQALLAAIRTECHGIVARTDVRGPAAAALNEMLDDGLLSERMEQQVLNASGGPG